MDSSTTTVSRDLVGRWVVVGYSPEGGVHTLEWHDWSTTAWESARLHQASDTSGWRYKAHRANKI